MWKFIKSNYNLLLILAAAGCFFAAFRLFIAKSFADPDGYYHARMAWLITHGQIGRTFPWLQYTTWNQVFADQHYLYHLLLVPFVQLSALHWSLVVFSSLAVLAFVLLLRHYRVNSWLWIIFFLIGSADFLFRISLVKANTLSLILLFLAIYFIHRKKYFWLGLLSAAFVWTYGGFVFLPVIVGLFVLVDLYDNKRLWWQPLAAVCLGILVGLVSHPQFPNIILSLYNQIFQAGLGAGTTVPVGVEWLPYTFQGLIKTNGPVLIIWLVAAGALIKNHRRNFSLSVKSLFLISFCFFVLMLKSQRFVEYWVPFALLFSALIAGPYFSQINWPSVRKLLRQHWQLAASAVVGIALMAGAAWSTLSQVKAYYASAPSQTLYYGAAQWLIANSGDRDIVFNTQWDQFPQLFYWDQKNYYVVGLDPTFMYRYDSGLYREWQLISNNRTDEIGAGDINRILRKDFHASYLLIERNRNAAIAGLIDSSGQKYFQQVYSDQAIILYRPANP